MNIVFSGLKGEKKKSTSSLSPLKFHIVMMYKTNTVVSRNGQLGYVRNEVNFLKNLIICNREGTIVSHWTPVIHSQLTNQVCELLYT